MMIQGIITYSKSLNSFWWKPTENKSIMWSDIMKLQNFKIKILKYKNIANFLNCNFYRGDKLINYIMS